jgi:hypothetical protein
VGTDGRTDGRRRDHEERKEGEAESSAAVVLGGFWFGWTDGRTDGR